MLTKEELNSLYRYSLSLTKNRDEAYDLLQSSIEKVLKSNPERVRNNVPYIRVTIRNHYIDELRKRGDTFFEPLEILDIIDNDFKSLEQVIVDEYELESIWRFLTPGERELLYLWAVEGYSAQEIADEWKLSRGTILSKIHRTRLRLMKLFEYGRVKTMGA